MPKNKTKRKQLSGPYPGKKKGTVSDTNGTKTSGQVENSENYICDVCTDAVDRLIQCERCLIWYCLKCSKLTDLAMYVLEENESIHWFCEPCSGNVIEAIQAFNPPENSSQEQTSESLIKKSIDTALGQFVTQLNNIMDEAKDHFKRSLSDASHQPVQMDTSNGASGEIPVQALGNNPGQVVGMIDEYIDRERRKSNLIFHNVPESENDDTVIKEIIEKELRVSDCEVVKSVRLGQKNSQRQRLLLVSVNGERTKWNILKAAPKLRHSSTFDKIYVSPDLTLKERQVNKQLRDELKRRRSSGEKNLSIRRGKIVVLSSANHGSTTEGSDPDSN